MLPRRSPIFVVGRPSVSHLSCNYIPAWLLLIHCNGEQPYNFSIKASIAIFSKFCEGGLSFKAGNFTSEFLSRAKLNYFS